MNFLQSYTFDVVRILSILTVFGQALAVIILIALLLEASTKHASRFISWFSHYGLLLMLIVAMTATIGSLFFSDIAGWNPCKDCWFQRIFMYPQVILLGIALWKKDRTIALYILVLSLIGMGIAIDHYADQVQAAFFPAPESLEPCDTSGESCAKTQIKFTFGYITIPMMALTAFLLNALGSISLLRRKK